MKTINRFRRRTLSAAVALALSPAAFAADFSFNGGNYVPGSTAPNPLAPGDVLNIGSGPTKFFNGVTFDNQGTVNWNADPLYFISAAVNNSGLWDARGDDTLIYYSGNRSTFTNTGTFRKSAGLGTTTIGALTFVNSGTINAQTGTIEFTGGTTSFNAGTVFSGAGVIKVSSDAAFNGSFNSANLVLQGGGFTGTDAKLNGTVDWRAGTLAGSWEVAAGQTLNAKDGSSKFFSNAAVVNKGTLAWQTADTAYFISSSLDNQGLLDVQADTQLAYYSGNQSNITNSGTVKVAAGKTLTVGGVNFINQGGVLTAGAGGLINFAGNAATFNAGTQFAGAGSNVVSSNATFNGGFSSSNLVLQAGGFTGAGAVIGGTVAYTGGTFAGDWQLAAGQTLNATATAGQSKFFTNAAFTNKGTVNWQTDDTAYFSSSSFDNQGQFNVQGSTTLSYYSGNQSTFTNSGTVQVAAGKTLTVGGVQFTNNGGLLAAAAGATLNFSGGAANFNDGTRFTGAGVNLVTGNANFNGAFDSANLVLQSGVYTGTGAVLNGTVGFSGGTLAGDWQIAAGQTLNATPTAGPSKFFTNGAVVNKGTLAWQSADTAYFSSSSFDNQGLFEAQADAALTYYSGNPSVFTNTGTLRAAAGKTLTVGGISFINNAGTVTAAGNAVVDFNGGSAAFNAGTVFNGAGKVTVTNHASFNGGFTASNLSLRNGTFTGTDALAQGAVEWTGGSVNGTWNVAGDGTINARSGQSKFLSNGTLTNRGTVNWQTGETLYMSSSSLVNKGRFDLQADATLSYYSGNQPTFVNEGLLVKSAGAGTANLSTIALSNAGTIDVRAGAIQLPNNFANAGILTGTGAFGTSKLINSGHVAPGNGAGVLTLNGAYQQLASGSLDIELATSLMFDTFVINGNAQLDGTLALSCIAGCALSDGDSFVILDATGQMTGTFAGITTSGFGNDFDYTLTYDDLNDLVRLEVIHAGLPVPEPGTWAMLAAGLGVLGSLARRRRVLATVA